ncbi:MAG: hypothetical protein DRR19_17715 [Candidatus Parabeggiatoa sp. nov. 1]|nr:MAG: hypothetical protein DRR19_17715 [Gammaproteobacteria bacterium]
MNSSSWLKGAFLFFRLTRTNVPNLDRVEYEGPIFPQVPPGAIHIQPFQPIFPQVPPGAIHIQPFQGWRGGANFSPGGICGQVKSGDAPTPIGVECE